MFLPNLAHVLTIFKELEVTEMLAHNNYCTDCPAGYYSEEGSIECRKCPVNTFSAQPGTEICSPCNINEEYSFEGSANCTKREGLFGFFFLGLTFSQECQVTDYYSWYTECQPGGSRTQRYSWRDPKVCKGGVSLPRDATVPCAPCNPGHFLNSQVCDFQRWLWLFV